MGIITSRRRVMGSKKLPYDAEVEYLEKNEEINGYFLTDYIPKGSNMPIFRLAFEFNGFYGKAQWDGYIYNAYTSQQHQAFRILRQNASLYQVQFAHGCDGSSAITAFYSPELGRYYEVLADPAFGYFLNGQNIGSIRIAVKENTGRLHILYGRVKAKIYYFQAEEHGNIVLDLIPVRVGTTGYLYDKVSGQLFGNQGTGSFILGPDKDSTVIITQQQQHEMYGE